MGGRIGLESLAGAGSIFWIELPAAPVDVEPVSSSTSHASGAVSAHPLPVAITPVRAADARAADLLVVEDNDVNQLVIAGMLKRLGYTHEIAEDGVKALERLAQGRFRAVLMDMHLPLLDGLEATRRFRASENTSSRLPIIALTANAQPRDRDDCLASGMDDFLEKPIEIRALQEKLGRWLDKREH
jgi:CheY-like chemotaxis protein